MMEKEEVNVPQCRGLPPEIEAFINEKIRINLDAHARVEAEMLNQRFEEQKQYFDQAFPGGDPHGHRMYHEEQIEFLRERKELYRELRQKTIVGLFWFLLTATCTALYRYAQAKIFGGPT